MYHNFKVLTSQPGHTRKNVTKPGHIHKVTARIYYRMNTIYISLHLDASYNDELYVTIEL